MGDALTREDLKSVYGGATLGFGSGGEKTCVCVYTVYDSMTQNSHEYSTIIPGITTEQDCASSCLSKCRNNPEYSACEYHYVVI